jgi:hypothetical protein
MKNFKEYLKETSGTISITFGNFNPPTIEHEKLLKRLQETASGGALRVYTSQECNEHFPLDYDNKIKFMRKAFPRYARNIISDAKITDLYSALTSLYEQGYKHVNIVMPNITDILKECVIKENGILNENKKLYNFKNINFISVDIHENTLEEKMIEAAKNNSFDVFSKNLPQASLKESHKLFNAIRTAYGLKESFNFRQHIQLPTLSKEREAYINGDLFKIGDVIEIKETKEIGQVKRLGSNYVIIETYEGHKQRKWLKDVIKVEEAVVNKLLGEKTCQPKKKIKAFKEGMSTFDGK